MATTTGTDVKSEDEIGPEKEQEKETKDYSNENNASVELYKEAKKEFLKGRQILIRNIPAISKEVQDLRFYFKLLDFSLFLFICKIV